MFEISELLAITFAYLIGSIPFGLILTRMAGLGDVRSIGSGNIGATNVMRTGKKWLGALTLLLDVGKGYIAVVVALFTMIMTKEVNYVEGPLMLAAAAAICGHCFPVWLKFKGGKGVATALGVLIAFNSDMALYFAAFWLFAAATTRYVSLASIFGFWGVLAVHVTNASENMLLFLAFVALLVTYTHRSNIERLKAGTESKIGKKKS